MATCVKSRTSQLPNPTDVKESTKLLESVLSASVSQIVYARRLLPEECFEDRMIEGQMLKILPHHGKSASGNRINRLLTQAFDALEKQYLHTLEMHICPEDDPNHVIEYYTYQFKYKNDEEGASVTLVSSNEHEKSTITVKPTQRYVYDLLHSTHMLMKYIIPSGDNFLLRFRLYYREGTPDDYDPPGYTSANPSCYQVKGKKFRNGIVQTDFHKMIVKSIIEEDVVDDVMPENNSEGGTQDEEAAQTNSQIQSSIPDSWSVPDGTPDMSCTQIGCICGIPVDSLMIQCAKCSLWHHGVCHRILSPESAPEIFNCLDCYSKTPSSEAFTDMSLQGIGSNEQKYICMYRFALVALADMRHVTAAKLGQLWHISYPVAEMLVKSLSADKILAEPVQPDQSARSMSWIVDVRLLKQDGMLKYFRLSSLEVPFLSEGAKAIEKSRGGLPAAKRVRFDDEDVFDP